MDGEEGAKPSAAEIGVKPDALKAPGTLKPETHPASTWESMLGGQLGNEFRDVARGRVENNRYHNSYTMREFADPPALF